MRHLSWLLAAAMMCSLPTGALASSHSSSSQRQSSSSCGTRHHDDDAGARHQPQCMAGVAVNVSWSGMKVRPAHGAPLRVRFTDETEFATDSGEGVLDGLLDGDYVCVSYRPHPGSAIALLVVFDPQSLPCGPARSLVLGDHGFHDCPGGELLVYSWTRSMLSRMYSR